MVYGNLNSDEEIYGKISKVTNIGFNSYLILINEKVIFLLFDLSCVEIVIEDETGTGLLPAGLKLGYLE